VRLTRETRPRLTEAHAGLIAPNVNARTEAHAGLRGRAQEAHRLTTYVVGEPEPEPAGSRTGRARPSNPPSPSSRNGHSANPGAHPGVDDQLRAAVEQLVTAIVAAVRAELPEPGAPDRLLSVEEAAHALGIGRSMVYALVADGRLRSLKVGRRRLVPSSALAELVEATE
jgi:excisionase family DNA binding protein